MIRFECDYAEGAHPRILERMMATNMEQTPGYGLDPHCERARELIKKECGKDVNVHFIVGGTQTNMIVLASLLKPYQGALCAVTGHIAIHETGAIEATGHKVLPLPSDDGKITAAQIAEAVDWHWAQGNREHIVMPGAVYISHPTENGTTYTKDELAEISATCKKYNLPLFLDGARLGYGMAAPDSTITMKDLAEYCDVFYIGGTKVGALFGEAVVFANGGGDFEFRYHIKQRGAMLAKGRLLGIQFETLFEDGLYYEISKGAIDKAMQIRDAFAAKGFKFLYDSPTNQQFPILPNDVLAKLNEKYASSYWEDVGPDHTAVRFCTSWATTQENVDELVKDIAAL